MDSENFWDFPACSKIDILHNKRHRKKICEALADPETKADIIETGRGILFGEESSVLVILDYPPLRYSIYLFSAFCKQFN